MPVSQFCRVATSKPSANDPNMTISSYLYDHILFVLGRLIASVICIRPNSKYPLLFSVTDISNIAVVNILIF